MLCCNEHNAMKPVTECRSSKTQINDRTLALNNYNNRQSVTVSYVDYRKAIVGHLDKWRAGAVQTARRCCKLLSIPRSNDTIIDVDYITYRMCHAPNPGTIQPKKKKRNMNYMNYALLLSGHLRSYIKSMILGVQRA